MNINEHLKNTPIDFDPEIYIQVNGDLSQMSCLEAKVHYENTGYLENRKYKYTNIPVDFDPEIYIELNDDLSQMSCLEAKIHYENTGYLENRKYKYSQINLNYSVYIYCSGKSGSSTLTHTMNNNGYNSLHLHGFDDFKLYCPESRINDNIFDIIEKSMLNNEYVYIIDSYRTPIERKLSSFFQNYKDGNKNIDHITNLIDNEIYCLENYAAINEILDYFNLPHFTTFDFNKKYNLLKYKNINFIKLRFQDINEWEHILTDIFKKPIKIHKENISENKSYYNEYNVIKTTYKIPKHMIDYIKNDTESKIYLSEEEFNNYINYWNTRVK